MVGLYFVTKAPEYPLSLFGSALYGRAEVDIRLLEASKPDHLFTTVSELREYLLEAA